MWRQNWETGAIGLFPTLFIEEVLVMTNKRREIIIRMIFSETLLFSREPDRRKTNPSELVNIFKSSGDEMHIQ